MKRTPHVVEIESLMLDGIDRLNARSAAEQVQRRIAAVVTAALAERGVALAEGGTQRIAEQAGASVADAVRGAKR
jgi:hypothetical protein